MNLGVGLLPFNRKPLKIIKASDAELTAHQQRLESINEASDGGCAWLKTEGEA